MILCAGLFLVIPLRLRTQSSFMLKIEFGQNTWKLLVRPKQPVDAEVFLYRCLAT